MGRCTIGETNYMSKLSVVVPLYNQEKYIEQCLKSIQNQKIEGLNIIVVDDGSTDDSGRICDALAENDSRISVIHQENKGLAGARYAGIKFSNSEYVTFVDADDFIEANAYDEAMEFINKDYDQIFYEISRYYENGEAKREYHVIEEGIYDRERITNEIYPKLIWDFERKTPGIECSQCVRIVKRNLLLDAYKNLNGKSFYYGEDIVITYPLMKKIQKLAVISKSYYMHRQRENGAAPEYIKTSGYFDEIAGMYKYLREKMNDNSYFDFNRQIDYMYMYSVCLKKWGYNDFEYSRDFLFPFNKVPLGRKVILYGAGLVGKTYYDQLTRLSYCSELLWVDLNAERINNIHVKPITELDEEKYKAFDNVVIALENKNIVKQVNAFLQTKGYSSSKIVDSI